MKLATVQIDITTNIATTSTNGNIFFFIFGIVVILVIVFIMTKKKRGFENKDKADNAEIDNQDKEKLFLIATVKKSVTQKTKIPPSEKIATPKVKNVINDKKIVEVDNKFIDETIEIKPQEEDQNKEKYIGYNPINIFDQTEPLNFPYVIMPSKHKCIIKFPRKGKAGRKGYKEESFKFFLLKYFHQFQIYDDRFVLIKNNSNPFEPDFVIIDERKDLNLFLDIEIDEPYEGLNDLDKRKPTHYQFSDINRNNSLKNRGWVTIRFAEIQIHQNPDSCCLFIADVIKSINGDFQVPEALKNYAPLSPIKQWTIEEADNWSKEKYREQYLGINNFGIVKENSFTEPVTETKLGQEIEQKVEDSKIVTSPHFTPSNSANLKLDLIKSCIKGNSYLLFTFQGSPTITKPIAIIENDLTAFCYIKNSQRNFSIYEISNASKKNNYYTVRLAGPTVGLDKITNLINTAISNKRYIRMKYTRTAFSNMVVDVETGDLIIDKIESEESIRTINDVQLSINTLSEDHINTYRLNSNYITAYCNKRDEQRTFKFDRIGEIEILDL